jgi:hypothetical protein
MYISHTLSHSGQWADIVVTSRIDSTDRHAERAKHKYIKEDKGEEKRMWGT